MTQRTAETKVLDLRKDLRKLKLVRDKKDNIFTQVLIKSYLMKKLTNDRRLAVALV